jgi:hypothetical protein
LAFGNAASQRPGFETTGCAVAAVAIAMDTNAVALKIIFSFVILTLLRFAEPR